MRAKAGRRSARRVETCGIQAYLDIETTGLDPHVSDLTVIGICRDDGEKLNMLQLVGDEITPQNLREAIEDVKTVLTYNGERFDLPFIKVRLGVDILENCRHRDLMHDCRRRNLWGGFKSVERQLGIVRATEGVDGRVAIDLWYDYVRNGNRDSLLRLLEYNREDVLNLRTLRRKLDGV